MKRIVFALLAMSFLSVGFAQEKTETKSADFSRWKVRVRGIGVVPNESASIGTIGGDVSISTALVPEFDFTYYFTKNIAAELILGTTKHDVNTVGVNYTIFYDVKPGDVVKDVSYDNAFGYAAQAGFDLMVTDKFFINADVKRLFLKTDVTVDASNLAPGLSIPAKVDINPWIIGMGVGVKF